MGRLISLLLKPHSIPQRPAYCFQHPPLLRPSSGLAYYCLCTKAAMDTLGVPDLGTSESTHEGPSARMNTPGLMSAAALAPAVMSECNNFHKLTPCDGQSSNTLPFGHMATPSRDFYHNVPDSTNLSCIPCDLGLCLCLHNPCLRFFLFCIPLLQTVILLS